MRPWVITFLALAGCQYFSVKSTDDEDDTAYGDSDSDTDGDTDSDTDTDTDTDADLCDQSLSTAAPGGPDCYDSTLSCGDTIEATNEGGTSVFGPDNWEGWYCTPNLDNWDYEGEERVYTIDIPAETQATFEFDTPCADLDLFVLYWQDADTCPTTDNSIRECEAIDDEGSGGSQEIDVFEDSQYLVIVDSRSGDAGNYRISVTCE